jgi:DNA-binding MarR family transcriptional regulator
MPQATFSTPGTSVAVSLSAAADLSLTLVRIMKLFQSMRAHAPRLHAAVDATAYPVLFNLHAGPKRVSELAECVHSDVSTVSRQTTALVSHGLAEKVTDPADGRAQVITLTAEGTALIERIKASRAQWFQQILADWDPEDIAGFTAYLDRFGDALEASRARALASPANPANPANPTGTAAHHSQEN